VVPEFVVVDLGTADEFARARLVGAQHLPEGATRFVDDFGYERRDKVLAYAHHADDSRIAPSDPRLAVLTHKYLKEILILQGLSQSSLSLSVRVCVCVLRACVRGLISSIGATDRRRGRLC
jgi:hypothetical protein